MGWMGRGHEAGRAAVCPLIDGCSKPRKGGYATLRATLT